jgi:hypothetical protein
MSQVVQRADMTGIFAVMALVFAGGAQASSYTGTLQQVLSSASPTTSGNSRVSIYTGSTTSCTGNPGWFSFDLPSASVASLWEATLLAAITAGKSVTINGLGTCDPYGLEIVSSIGALP